MMKTIRKFLAFALVLLLASACITVVVAPTPAPGSPAQSSPAPTATKETVVVVIIATPLPGTISTPTATPLPPTISTPTATAIPIPSATPVFACIPAPTKFDPKEGQTLHARDMILEWRYNPPNQLKTGQVFAVWIWYQDDKTNRMEKTTTRLRQEYDFRAGTDWKFRDTFGKFNWNVRILELGEYKDCEAPAFLLNLQPVQPPPPTGVPKSK